MHSEGLGRVFNAHYPADDVYISLVDAAGVTFLVHEVDGATVSTLTFASDAAGTATTTANVITQYYGKSADVAAGVWHKTTQAASNVVTKADGTEDYIAIFVNAAQCPDGYPYVKCSADGSGTVTAITHDLLRGRAPANLRSIIA